MSRTVPEWIGRTDDDPTPPRVRLRLFERAAGKCACCTRKIGPADTWEADHVIAVINGGPNRESNLQVLCGWCHAAKTKTDVAVKSRNARVRAKHAGIKQTRNPLPGSRSSGWKRKITGEWVRRDR